MKHEYSKYFNAVIKKLVIEPKSYLDWVSFFKRIERTKDEYFMFCSLDGAGEDFQLKIQIKKDDYEKSKVEDKVSIHLNFNYDFTCFFYPEKVKTGPKILDMNNEVDRY